MIRYIFTLLLCASAVFGVEPDEVLFDPVLEERARGISVNLRCVVCQNASIDVSNAGIARDLRLLVRERLVAGDSDTQVYDYIVARYGEYVLFKPFWKPSTYALWLMPLLFIILGVWIAVSIFRRANVRSAKVNALSPQEEAELSQINARHNNQDYA